MKALVIKLNAIGDVIFATPLVEALHRAYPGLQVDWLVAPHAEPILRGHAGVRQRILFEGSWGRSRLRRWLSVPRLLLRLRREHYNLVFVLHRSSLAKLIAAATGAGTRVGFEGPLSKLTLTHTVPFDEQEHETERYLDLLRALDQPVENPGPKLGLTYEAQVLAELTLTDRAARTPLIGLAPGGGRNPGTEMLIKRWPAERYAELAARLAEELGAGVLVLGTPDEAELCQAVAAAAGEAGLNLCGQTTLSELAALLARCRVVVANDSGPLHIAAAVGVPTVALFGPTDPRLVAPLGPKHRYLWTPPECGPCYRPDNARDRSVWTCERAGDELRCLLDVPVDTVLAAVKEALAGRLWPQHEPYWPREPVRANGASHVGEGHG